MRLRPTKALMWSLAAVAACLCLALGAFNVLGGGGNPGRKKDSPAVLAAKQDKAAALAYPDAGPTPRSITVSYDQAKDRTRIRLELKGVRATTAGTALAGATLALESEFRGQARTVGELSVRGTVSVSGAAGALAPSSPPGVFTADGKQITAHAWQADRSGYSSDSKGGVAREELVFRVRTKDLLPLAESKSVSGEFGAVTLALSAGQIHELREFVARMKPVAAR